MNPGGDDSEIRRNFQADFAVDRRIHRYCDLYDVPRLFSVEASDGQTWILVSYFVEEQDDYCDRFDVHLSPRPTNTLDLSDFLEIVGGGPPSFTVPVSAFVFDASRRKTLRLRSEFDAAQLRAP